MPDHPGTALAPTAGSGAADPADIVLVGLNARYTHTCLAIRLLRTWLIRQWPGAPRIELAEWTVNDPADEILRSLFQKNARLYAFSCYIWNIGLVRLITRWLKKVLPGALVIWGGPEAAHDAAGHLARNPAADAIVRGEGEAAFLEFCRQVFGDDRRQPPRPECRAQTQEAPSSHRFGLVPSLTWRDPGNGEIRENPDAPLLDAADWPFPYDSDDLDALSGRIIYYETSRGCPYRCSYCLSALDRTVRRRPLPLVFDEIDRLIASNPLQVKLVDRTFNDRPERARAIWCHILSKQHETGFTTVFHFEAAGELLDDASVDLLNTAPPGLIKLEIGIQSIHPAVLEAVGRPFSPETARRRIMQLRQAGRVHLHLDLIAGLPGESLPMFAESFNWVYQLQPQQLQLGFLKVLPGSPICRTAAERGFVWQDEPPYEILCSDALSFGDLALLKFVENLVGLYYNSGLFSRSLAWLASRGNDPFAFFAGFAGWPPMEKRMNKPLSPADRAWLLWSYGLKDIDNPWLADAWRGLVRLDYLSAGHKDQPEWLGYLESNGDPPLKKEIARLRNLYLTRFPESRRLRIERFPFAWETLRDEGRLVPGTCLACFDISGQQAVLLDITSQDTLY